MIELKKLLIKYKKMKIYKFITVFLFAILGCNTERKNKVNESQYNIVPIKSIDLLMINDTLEKSEEKGVLRFFYDLNDTIKLTSSDKMKVTLLLSINSYDKTIDNSLIEVVEKKIIITPFKIKDTIEIPFIIKPHFKGKAYFKGLISDRYFLNSYTGDDEIRMLEYDNVFKKDVYIK